MRKGIKKSILVYTSAYNNLGQNDPRPTAAQLLESGYDIITVAFIEKDASMLALHISEISSPNMNFTTYKDSSLVDEIIDSFCQTNCYCLSGWHQAVINNRRFGECYFSTTIDATWLATRYECQKLSSVTKQSHLVYINSEYKNQYINNLVAHKWQTSSDPHYFIGYYFNTTFNRFVWVNGIVNSRYTNWAPHEPLMEKANTAVISRQVIKNSVEFRWYTEQENSLVSRAICQDEACDTANYCP